MTLAFRIFDLTEKFPSAYFHDLTSQLRRAALSVPTNIAEGCASFHTRELLQFLNISRRSLSETQYLFDFACRRKLIMQADFLELESMSAEVSKTLNGLINSLRKRSTVAPSTWAGFPTTTLRSFAVFAG
jgi:four helix bundle protein